MIKTDVLVYGGWVVCQYTSDEYIGGDAYKRWLKFSFIYSSVYPIIF